MAGGRLGVNEVHKGLEGNASFFQSSRLKMLVLDRQTVVKPSLQSNEKVLFNSHPLVSQPK